MSVFTIAEIGQAHNGSISMLYTYIDALAKTGVDAVKFQTHIADAESSVHEPFRIKFSDEDKTRYEYWKRMEFTTQEWVEIGKRCKDHGLVFMSSPFSNAAVDILEEAEVEIYKVGSGEVNNFLLLKKIIDTCKPIIISSGMSSFRELDEAIAFLNKYRADYSLLQCTTSYPTVPENYGLNVIGELKNRYGVKVGYSDHSAKISTGIAAIALGAEILEFHAVLDRDQFGPDVTSSLTMDEIPELIEGIRSISEAVQNPIDKEDNSDYSELKSIFEKSMAINKALQKGHILSFEDLEAKKPKGYGIEASQYVSVIGMKLSRDLKQWDFLTKDDIE